MTTTLAAIEPVEPRRRSTPLTKTRGHYATDPDGRVRPIRRSMPENRPAPRRSSTPEYVGEDF